MSANNLNKNMQTAWVVFSGRADMAWLKMLRPGFRHCFVLLNDGERWITLDPLSNHMDVTVHHHLPASFNLPCWLQNRGQHVIRAELCRDSKKAAPWMVFTCVEAVKRVLGLRDRFILTPWQLYRHLQKLQNKTLLKSTPNNKGEFAWGA